MSQVSLSAALQPLEDPELQEPTSQDPELKDPQSQDLEDPQSQEPTSQEPTSQEPTSQEPTSQEPTSQEPTSQEPTSQDMLCDQSSPQHSPQLPAKRAHPRPRKTWVTTGGVKDPSMYKRRLLYSEENQRAKIACKSVAEEQKEKISDITLDTELDDSATSWDDCQSSEDECDDNRAAEEDDDFYSSESDSEPKKKRGNRNIPNYSNLMVEIKRCLKNKSCTGSVFTEDRTARFYMKPGHSKTMCGAINTPEELELAKNNSAFKKNLVYELSFAPNSMDEKYVPLREHLFVKIKPCFSTTVHKLWKSVCAQGMHLSFDVLKEAVEGLYCLIEKPVTVFSTTTDAFFEDLQTFAHLTLYIDFYIMKLIYMNRCSGVPSYDNRPNACSSPIDQEEMLSALHALFEVEQTQPNAYAKYTGQKIVYVAHLKRLVDIVGHILACNMKKMEEIQALLFNVEAAKQILLYCLLQKHILTNSLGELYPRQGDAACRFLMLQHIAMNKMFCFGKAEGHKRYYNVELEKYMGKVKHRRSYRTIHAMILPLGEMTTELYAEVLNRQLAVGLVPLFDFSKSEGFKTKDRVFYRDASDCYMNCPTFSLAQCLSNDPDPVMDKRSLLQGLSSTVDGFSMHRVFPRAYYSFNEGTATRLAATADSEMYKDFWRTHDPMLDQGLVDHYYTMKKVSNITKPVLATVERNYETVSPYFRKKGTACQFLSTSSLDDMFMCEKDVLALVTHVVSLDNMGSTCLKGDLFCGQVLEQTRKDFLKLSTMIYKGLTLHFFMLHNNTDIMERITSKVCYMNTDYMVNKKHTLTAIYLFEVMAQLIRMHAEVAYGHNYHQEMLIMNNRYVNNEMGCMKAFCKHVCNQCRQGNA
ncbi:Similar to Lymphocryptovirus Macaca BPLF1 [Bufonid herpesvirus 1]|uniref:Similar to Lymphocryptovirus Macaca BPLF1 n=1 Tax=Bufonid herpesvirus 1 TaxID=2282206 RepID=UPI000EB71E75|nr:Similar to Lymphocryptovirus Macaca BPLF1 [Bufonid herpesvirus 1]AXF48650.1 Similar to Lymphocryptovirus Macaca BPLF1 [Bufonid herpesvirus 1]